MYFKTQEVNIMNYSTSAAIPSPKDIKNYPLSLFINSVLNCDTKLLERVDSSNYQSFIAALSKSTLNDTNNAEHLAKIRYAANMLLTTIINKRIDYEHSINEIKLLVLMSNLDVQNLDKFHAFEAQISY